ncbi:hypothetical protein [Streptomyces sp. NPDC008137]|uniref:hypothetical protein n=1 Tax=Streptomyces sp. NPDC008137 TaxID=3364813 RepID=UPI0036E3B115
MSTTTTEEPHSRAVKLLAVPDLATLTDAQVAGRVCVWGSGEDPLTGASAVDLGERLTELSGSTSPMRWFPRSCPLHAGERAMRALFTHCEEDCEQCGRRTDKRAGDGITQETSCEVGIVLRRLAFRKGQS